MKIPRKNPFYTVVICMLLLLLSQTAVAFALTFIQAGDLFRQDITFEAADAAMLEIMQANQTLILLISYALVLIALWFMARRKKMSFAAYTGLQLPTRKAVMVLAVAAGLAAAFWATIAVNLMPWPEELLANYQAESSILITAKPVVDFLAVVCLGPVVEELLFRGLIYQALCTAVPAGAAVIFQGMLFGSVHGTAIWMAYAFFMGCLLGYVRKRTDSLRPCIGMHMAFNGASYLVGWFAQNYGEDPTAIKFMFVASAFVLLLSMYGISFRTQDQEKHKN